MALNSLVEEAIIIKKAIYIIYYNSIIDISLKERLLNNLKLPPNYIFNNAYTVFALYFILGVRRLDFYL
jgi:hypothetical protein